MPMPTRTPRKPPRDLGMWAALATAVAVSVAVALFAPGCDEPKPRANADDGFIVGKTTTDVRKANEEVAKGGQVVTPKVSSRDPITLSGNVYVTAIGQISIMKIDAAMNLYKAENDRYPKDFDEFKSAVLDANQIALPALPRYQKYGYDEAQHKLVIIEYPELKVPDPIK